MAYELVTSMIASSGAIIVAVVTYWFTKKREREAELRKERFEHYKEFIASLSGIIVGESSSEGQRRFSLACNKLNLIAPLTVVKALYVFQNESQASNQHKSQQKHDEAMSRLLYEMRKDLGVVTPSRKNQVLFRLWSAGVPLDTKR